MHIFIKCVIKKDRYPFSQHTCTECISVSFSHLVEEIISSPPHLWGFLVLHTYLVWIKPKINLGIFKGTELLFLSLSFSVSFLLMYQLACTLIHQFIVLVIVINSTFVIKSNYLNKFNLHYFNNNCVFH